MAPVKQSTVSPGEQSFLNQQRASTRVLVERCRFCGSRKGTPHTSAVHLAVEARSPYEQYYPTWEEPPADFSRT